MLLDVYRFKRDSEELLRADDYGLTLDAFLKRKGYSRAFIQHFIIPMGEAIWSPTPWSSTASRRATSPSFFKTTGSWRCATSPSG